MKDLNSYLDMLWKSITVEFVIKFVIIYFFIIWISLVIWVLKDIRNRTTNLIFQFFCVLIPVLLTPFGIFIYLLVRPTKTLYEKYYDEIEENLDLIYEIIEERKTQFEKKINNSIEEETKIVNKNFPKINTIKLDKKIKVDSEEKIEPKKSILDYEKKKEIKELKEEGKIEKIEILEKELEKNIGEPKETPEKSPLRKLSLRKLGSKSENPEKTIKLTKLKRKKF